MGPLVARCRPATLGLSRGCVRTAFGFVGNWGTGFKRRSCSGGGSTLAVRSLADTQAWNLGLGRLNALRRLCS